MCARSPGRERRVEREQVIEAGTRSGGAKLERLVQSIPAPDHEWQCHQRLRIARQTLQRLAQTPPILSVDPRRHVRAQRLLQRVESRREHAHVAQIDLKVLEPGGGQERQGQPYDLDVGGEVALAQQLGPDLEHLARPAPALRILAEHLARIAEAQRSCRVRKRRCRHPCQAGGEIISKGEDPSVAIGKADQPLGDLRDRRRARRCPRTRRSVG